MIVVCLFVDSNIQQNVKPPNIHEIFFHPNQYVQKPNHEHPRRMRFFIFFSVPL